MASGPIDAGLLDPASGGRAAVVGDEAYVRAMVDAEQALLTALAAAGAGPQGSTPTLADIPLDLAEIASGGRASGNPVIPLLAALRKGASPEVRDLLHLGATSQDILDTAAMLVADRARREIGDALPGVLSRLSALADEHRAAVVAGRTLGQQAAPTTVGLRIAVLLDGIARAWEHLRVLELPAQLGGSVGTLAVLTDQLGPDATDRLRRAYAETLGLTFRPVPWHVQRGPVAELGAALAVLIGALGRLGLELAHGARTEIGELDVVVGEGEGGSSAMPQKRNPVAAVLLVAAGRRAPGLASTLLAAQLALDDRPAGDWHAEWQPLRELLRLAVESAELAQHAVDGLAVRPERALRNLELSGGAVHAERAQWALVPYVGRARASALVREALAHGAFVDALTAAVQAEPNGGPDAAARIREVAATEGAIGLSDSIIDAARAAAEGSA
ncbi:MAG: putative intramolecular lyase [Naasia sp.]|jgi:3-carboxy-cis,cis-muconate cycloisomerase|uniref:lyase family protein n=1 Tax=Naasia sp. TaxID=2546198 RepID=UPI002630DB33|nr:lyase family protein [Naasia sp.]MCU1571437.1 putative intramolecular lyase [Naasia sp.]